MQKLNKHIIPKILFIIYLPFLVIKLDAQEFKTGDDADHHEHHKNEIGIANSLVYFANEKIFSYGLHIHYVYKIKNSDFGFGIGYERIFDLHKHNTFGLVGNYQPVKNLNIELSPGFTFEGNKSNELYFSLHLGTSYEFEINDLHIGPVIELAYHPEGFHISLGLHIGLGF